MENSLRIFKIESLVRFLSYSIGILGFVSILRFIDIIYTILFVILFALSIYLDNKQNNPLPRWTLNIISLFFILIAFMRVSMDDPIKPIVESLLILLAIKFLEKKSIRDYMQIYLISVLLLTGSALLSLNIEFAIYLSIMMFLLSIAIISLTFYSQDQDLILKANTIKNLILKSLIIPVIALPLTVLLFFILPRTSYPLLNFLNRDTAITGFSDSIMLGGISDIQIDDAVVMRVKMNEIDPSMLYWRGIILDYFDGISWRTLFSEKLSMQNTLRVKGKRVFYTIYLEPVHSKYLFFLDKPNIEIIPKMNFYDDLTVMLDENINRRIKYDATSIISDLLIEVEINRDRYLQLPKIIDKRIIEKVKELSSNLNEEDSALAILNFLKYGDYQYSLKNLPITSSPLEDFLFVYKYGNCEYFASAMTVMLRLRGIPARIVGGYKGGYYNEIGKYYIITQRFAHVWVEAYIKNKGWLRFDPTTSSAIDSPVIHGIFSQLRIILDTINYNWNAVIINYNFPMQIHLMNKIRFHILQPKFDILTAKKQILQFLPLIIILLIFALIFLFINKRKTYEEKILSKFLHKMKKFGYTKDKTEGLEEFANRIEVGQLKDKAICFVQTLESYIYKDKKLSKQEYQKLNQMLKDFKSK